MQWLEYVFSMMSKCFFLTKFHKVKKCYSDTTVLLQWRKKASLKGWNLNHKPAWKSMEISTWCFANFCTSFLFPFSNMFNFHSLSPTLHLYFQSDDMLASQVYFLLTPRVFLCGRWHCFLTLGRSCHSAHSSGLWLLSLSPCFSIAHCISPFISTHIASWGTVSPWLAQSLNRAPCCPILRNTGCSQVSELLKTVI